MLARREHAVKAGEAGDSLPLTRQSKDGLLNQITEEMKSMRNHFIVATLIAIPKGQARAPMCGISCVVDLS